MNRLLLDDDICQNLEHARQIYSNKNQIMVCMEELCELACVLAKYPRYEEESKATLELHDKVLDEVADVMIILNHVQNIFQLSDEDISKRIMAKMARLHRWLEHSNSMQETVDDRRVEATMTEMCFGCSYEKTCTSEEYINNCGPCHQAQATEGIAPFYKGKEDEV